jgi:heat shock protein HslJ
MGLEHEMEGTTWSPLTLDGHPVLSDTRVMLTFGADRALTGSTGCNRFSGTWERADGRLTLRPGGVTRRACRSPVMQQEREFLDVLQRTGHFRQGARLLTLEDEHGNELAVLEPQEAARLTDVTWYATLYNNGLEAAVSLLAQTQITAEFSDEGKLSGTAGCNHYRGSYTRDGNALTIGPLVTTRRACEPAIMEQEQRYLAALQRVTTLRLDVDNLNLRDADGSLQARFRLAP